MCKSLWQFLLSLTVYTLIKFKESYFNFSQGIQCGPFQKGMAQLHSLWVNFLFLWRWAKVFKGEGSARPSQAELLQTEEIKPNFFLTLISFIRLTNLMNSGQRDTSEKKDVPVPLIFLLNQCIGLDNNII